MKKEKLKEMFKGKRKTENLVVLLVLLIVVVIAINYIWKDESENEITENESNYIKEVSVSTENKDETETKLEEILSTINGVGKVKVMLTYKVSSSITPVYDETSKVSNTTENDDSGGTRTILQTEERKANCIQRKR